MTLDDTQLTLAVGKRFDVCDSVDLWIAHHETIHTDRTSRTHAEAARCRFSN